MINITEIFFSIQGESSYAGLPCIFIRLAGCNLKCKYCDTEFSFDESKSYSIEQIITEIAKYPTKLVEVTGGEPLCQNNVYNLFNELIVNDYQVLLETNGSVLLDRVPKEIIKIVDIKTPESGFPESFDYNNISYINKKRDEIKFVIGSESDYEWMKNKIRQFKLDDYNVLVSTIFTWISPQKIVEMMLRDGLNARFQLQLHKYIWNPNERGV